MKCRNTALLIFILAASVLAQEDPSNNGEILPLPRWSKEELQSFRDNLGDLSASSVLPPGSSEPADINELLLSPVTSGPRLDDHFNHYESQISPRLQPEGMRFFLPESILAAPKNRQMVSKNGPSPLSSLQQVTPEFLASASLSLPGEYLIDPDQLLSEMHQQEMVRFLEFHAHDARIRLYVMVIPHDRKITDETSLDAVASGALLKNDSCLLVFPLGEPWRARLFLSKGIHDQTSPAFLNETLQACLQEAFQSSEEHDQLKRYAIHLSTRLFWLQKALGGHAPTIGNSELAEVLAEKTSDSRVTSVGLPVGSVWPLFAVLFGLGFTLKLALRFRHYRQTLQRNRVWILAEPETLPRLGGAFAGGGGGMIRY
jgi:hypothetical protein